MDSYQYRLPNAYLNHLWEKGAGDSYPSEFSPYSSCTRKFLQQVQSLLSPKQPKTAIDLGCGAGGFSRWLNQALNCHVLGIDRSEFAIEFAKQHARNNPDIEFVVGEFEQLNQIVGRFDLAVSVDALPFTKDEDQTLADIHRLLNPSGDLLFTTREPLATSPKSNKLGRAWCSVLERNSFELVEVIEREGVSEFWHSIYQQWTENEAQLRLVLPSEEVDGLMLEAEQVGSGLFDGRPWLESSTRIKDICVL
ncbi:class I SAM-dependent methyltransferase [Vibrio sp. Sgm 5]|uniref:class I SAM-dependent methyltransferase n=1 Tax=Vibrio sp. Sgm 5 TaxID=2994387 RepID=UPI002249653A|nr:methyltransferase domain-containing protein [Vibrio sp. Sgm 5]MCX2789497.1 methyltransferase domain-containing protein [Vibrio sp. Sgm 5]